MSAVSLERFGERFALHGTLGKLLNVCNEPGPVSAPAENTLKAVVGQDRLAFERKYQDPFEAKATIRVVILTNNAPPFADRTERIWRRAMFLPFNIVVPPERRDKHLADKLLTELPGIFLWAMAGYRRLKQQGDFTRSTACDAVTSALRRDANPARQFLDDFCRRDASAGVECQVLYSKYVEWAKNHGHKPVNDRELGKEIDRVFKGVEHKRITVNGQRKYHYVGLTLDHGGDSTEGGTT